MQIKTTYFGQHFHFSLVDQDKNLTMILSNTDDTHSQVVPVDNYELIDMAQFILKYLQDNK